MINLLYILDLSAIWPCNMPSIFTYPFLIIYRLSFPLYNSVRLINLKLHFMINIWCVWLFMCSYLWEEWKERHKESASDSSDKFLNLRFLSLEVCLQTLIFSIDPICLRIVSLVRFGSGTRLDSSCSMCHNKTYQTRSSA